MGFTSIDNFISEVTSGKFWRQDFMKLYSGAAGVAGNWYDLSQGGGNPAPYIHANMVLNSDFVTSGQPWIYQNLWAYTPATHLMTRTAGAGDPTLTQAMRVTAGVPYFLTYILARTAGAITPSLGGTNGTARSSAGTFREIIICGTTNQNLTFTADATFAGTIDLITIQPMVGFVPYNEFTEGALYHGGDVAPDTKHLVNFGAWTNAATGVPSVLMLVDVLGAYPRTATNSAAFQVQAGHDSFTRNIVHDCQTDWDQQTPANTTHALVVKATEGIVGGGSTASCVKLTVSNGTFVTGIVASKLVALATTSYNYAYSNYVYAWVRSTINLAAGDIAFCTDETANLASSQDVLLPALSANTWTRVRLDVSSIAMTDKDVVISIGMKVVVDKDQTFSVYWDDVRWAQSDPVIYNGGFTGNANGWSLGAGWTYNSNNVIHTAGVAPLSQVNNYVRRKCPYRITFTIGGRSAGSVTAKLGSDGIPSDTCDVNGIYEVIITAGVLDYDFFITPTTDFDGTIDGVIITPLFPRCGAGTADYGKGVRMYYALDNLLSNGAGAATTVVKYTNQDGVENRYIGATVNNTASDAACHIMHSGVGAGKFGPFLPMNAGDYGIRTIDGLQFSAAQATADAACNIIVCKPIASIPLTTTYVAAERDLMNQLPSLPKIEDGACLMFLVHSGAALAAGTGFMGYCDFAYS